MSADKNITAEIVCDVTNKYGSRWTCFKVRYPRIIMAEVNTHRMLSKVSASSRAIPISKQIEKVRTNQFYPSWVGKNQSGMQAKEFLDKDEEESFCQNWKLAAGAMATIAGTMERIGVHKQITNRILEPWLYVETLIAGTEWNNFFALRAHKDAQPEFAVLAYRMLEQYLINEPSLIDGWAGPFMDKMPEGCSEHEKKMICVARCARISYENFNGKINKEDDFRLASQLMNNGHMSPFEFCVMENKIDNVFVGNVRGFVQFRKMIQGENRSMNLEDILANKPDWI